MERRLTVAGVLADAPCVKCGGIPAREDPVYVPLVAPGDPPRLELLVCTACAPRAFAPATLPFARRVERAEQVANEAVAARVRAYAQAIGLPDREVVLEVAPARVPLAPLSLNGAVTPSTYASSVRGEIAI